jgi:hypothetical protein
MQRVKYKKVFFLKMFFGLSFASKARSLLISSGHSAAAERITIPSVVTSKIPSATAAAFQVPSVIQYFKYTRLKRGHNGRMVSQYTNLAIGYIGYNRFDWP